MRIRIHDYLLTGLEDLKIMQRRVPDVFDIVP